MKKLLPIFFRFGKPFKIFTDNLKHLVSAANRIMKKIGSRINSH